MNVLLINVFFLLQREEKEIVTLQLQSETDLNEGDHAEWNGPEQRKAFESI